MGATTQTVLDTKRGRRDMNVDHVYSKWHAVIQYSDDILV